MTSALEGVLVVAIEQAVAAPACTVRLADAGARVIKIERMEGDTARHYDQAVGGVSAYFAWLNRGKESAALNLKDKSDLALVQRMIGRADVFVQNLAPGAAARLGLGARELLNRHPRLIVVDIVGYDQSTSYQQMRAYDLLVQAESGICAVTGTPEVPSKVGVSIADIGTGMNAHALILEALLQRGKTGHGQAIEVAMFDSMADWMAVPFLHMEHLGRETERYGMSHASIYPYRPYACRDGDLIIAVQNPAEWRRFCNGVLLHPELASDPLFIDNPARLKNRMRLDGVIAALFAGLSCAEAIARLESHQIAWARVTCVRELPRHPALRRATAELPDGRSFEVPVPAGRRDMRHAAVPSLGRDTDRLRAEFAG